MPRLDEGRGLPVRIVNVLGGVWKRWGAIEGVPTAGRVNYWFGLLLLPLFELRDDFPDVVANSGLMPGQLREGVAVLDVEDECRDTWAALTARPHARGGHR